jgi:predicted permease
MPPWKRFTNWITGRADRELDRELRAHLDLEAEEQRERGAETEQARYAARRAFGNSTAIKEETRAMWGWTSLEQLAQDLRFAARIFYRSPAFAAVAVLSLALGIGANTAIFSLVNAILLRTLPVTQPEQLVLLSSFQRDSKVGDYFAYPDYRHYSEHTQALSGLLAATRVMPINVGLGAATTRAQAAVVSDNYFSVLGVPAQLGRMFNDQDDATPLAVISHGFWRRSFAEDSSVVGTPLTINGTTCAIAGVAPPEFFGESVGQAPDIWLPMAMHDKARFNQDMRGARYVTWLNLIGRLKPGMTLEQARAESNVLVSEIHAELGTDPNKDYLHHIEMEPGGRGLAGLRERLSAPLLVLMAVVALVLLVACTNLASLLLARAAMRQKEIATRLAIGASRGRLVRQLLTESVALALLGGAAGLLFSAWSTRLLVNMVSEGVVFLVLDLGPDVRILLFTAAVSLLTGILFGLAPVLQAVGRDVSPALKLHSRSVASRGPRVAWSRTLIAAQIGLSLLLLSAAGLFIRSLWNLKTLDAGFRADNVLLVEMDAQHGYKPQWDQVAARLIERAQALPGIESASVSFNGTLGESGSGVNGLEIEGYSPQSEQDQRARADWVGPKYFQTFGIPLLEGREFSAADNAGGPRVAVINQTMARYYFGEQSAIGRRVQFNQNAYEIIGVVKDAKYSDLREDTPRMLYFALLQNASAAHNFELRTAGSPLAFAPAVREMIREVDPRLNIADVTTLLGRVDRKLTRERLVADISGFFSGLTLLLAAIGIYGTLAHAVTRRTNEIGIRMALGAQRSRVIWMVLADMLPALAAGLFFGVLGILALGQLLTSMLFELQPSDPGTILLAAFVVSSAALAAGFLPARRASRVNPVVALRLE